MDRGRLENIDTWTHDQGLMEAFEPFCKNICFCFDF